VNTTSEASRLPFGSGVFVALVTPFGDGGEIDEGAYRRLIRHVIDDVDGLVPCGSTGELPYLSPAEKKRLVEIAIDEAGGKPVIAGACAPSTREAVELARDAEDAGASACLVVTPYYLHPADKGLYQHFRDVAAAVALPIVLYNIPQLVGAPLPRTVIEDLADIDNVVALKDSSGNLSYTLEVLEMVQGRIDVLVGHDEVVLPALAGGCSGAILGSANVMPDIWQEVLRCVRDGDIASARELQSRVQKLARIFVRHGGGVAVKAALNTMGVKVGRPRRPLMATGGALLHETRAEIRLELEQLGKVEARAPAEEPEQAAELAERFDHLGLSAATIREAGLKIGTGSAGEEPEDVRLDVVAGPKAGPLGDAYAYQLTYPRHRRQALTTILEPNLAVRPPTLIVPTLDQKNLRQANMIYGPTQTATAKAIVDALEAGMIADSALEDTVMIVSATVDPKALDRHALHRSVREAMRAALEQVYGDGPGAAS
jgi:4-hydroxy-tetrahydrodipicolinate synthase